MKILYILFFISSFLSAKTYEGTYKISYGIFGELGEAKTTLTIDNDIYTIDILAKATGFAKFLSNGKVERYFSKGKIINNEFYSNEFITKKFNNTKEKTKLYTFDYDKKTIYLNSISKKLQTTYSNNFEESNSKWITSKSNSENSFFTTNDILSLFFNVTKSVKTLDRNIKYEYKTLGAKAENGKINFHFPNVKEKNSLDSFFKNKNDKLIVTLNQPIFSSKNGELMISVNNDGFCNKAILKDVLMFGDITGELVDFITRN